jgi:hypothetical protein
MRKLAFFFVAPLALAVLACAPEPDAGTAVQAAAPMIGDKADGVSSDLADRNCQVVLREITRQMGDNALQTQCTAGVCNWVWAGSVEVAEGLAGTVRVLYRRVGDPTWWQVDAAPAAYSQPGFARHAFTIHEHLIGPDASEAELAATSIELMPFLELPDGTRLFDHNRRPGDFENYVLDPSNYFGLSDEGACAPQFGRISFFDNWDEYLYGTLRQGAYLVIDYNIDRLPTCRGTHNGYPAWDIVAHVKFAPGGQLVTGSVRAFDTPQGVPTGPGHAESLTVKIPADATAVEIWFHNYTGAGSSCQAWDSNYGANYHYEIWPPADHPRCKDIERWTKINSDMPYSSKPYCVDYTVEEHHNADSCELYLSGIGDGYMGHYGIPNNWVEAYVTVAPQQGTLLGVGMLTLYHDTKNDMAGQRTTFARQVASDTWQTGFIYLYPGIMGSNGYKHNVEQIAFFVDVQRPTGEVVRLWQSRHGANYSWNDAFSTPTTSDWIAYGSIKYAGDAAAIFDAKHSCDK